MSRDADGQPFSVPLGASRSGVLRAHGRAERIALCPLAPASYRSAPALMEARFRRAQPVVRVDGGAVSVGFGWGVWPFTGGRGHADIALATGLPWQIQLQGGFGELRADLRDLGVTGVELRGGFGEIDLRLPRPVGTVQVRIHGGIDRVSLRRPAGVPVRLALLGGATDLNLDALHMDSIGGSASWDGPGYADAADRFEIDLMGGVDHVTVAAEAADDERRG